MSKNSFPLLKQILILIIIILFGCITIIFSCLYLDLFKSGFFYKNNTICKITIYAITTTIAIFTIIFYKKNKQLLYKIFLLTIILFSISFLLLYLYIKTGLNSKFTSIESFREYIETFGSFAPILFITVSFLQVVVLPIPAFLTVGTGTLLFGPFLGGVYSFIGIFLGSIVAYFIGRLFGKKVASWLVGKNNLEKGLNTIKGKDKIILTFMFLFPFFPDDVLCFVAGITTISPLFFIVMIFFTRLISIFSSTYSMNNNLIPYNTWWGIVIWAIIFILIIYMSYLVIKHGNKIENYFKKKFRKKQ